MINQELFFFQEKLIATVFCDVIVHFNGDNDDYGGDNDNDHNEDDNDDDFLYVKNVYAYRTFVEKFGYI